MKMNERKPILDRGAVVLLETMGSDNDVLDAARISYSSNQTKKHTDAQNKKLLRYLMRQRHTSVFEMCEVKFYLKVPIFIARQLVRHRTANLNELSGRYSELPEEFWVPELEDLGPQSSENNQGRAPLIDKISAKTAQSNIKFSAADAFATYDKLLNVTNVSREVARSVLPLSTYTAMYWKCDLHNFFHFAKLRMDSHAQKEIREMATAMYTLVKEKFPISAEAFEDYILYAHSLSRLDQELLKLVLTGTPLTYERAESIGMSKREYNEFLEWITSLSQ